MSASRWAPWEVTLLLRAADVVLMDDDPAKISLAMKISRKCMHIVYQNIVFALAVKAIFLLLGAFGIANMWWAVFADVGVMILAVLNAMRMLIVERTKATPHNSRLAASTAPAAAARHLRCQNAR